MEADEDNNNSKQTSPENTSSDHQFEISADGQSPWIISCILSAIKHMGPTCDPDEMKEVLITNAKRQVCIKNTYENLKKYAEERKFLQQTIVSGGTTVFETAWPNTTNRTAIHHMLCDIIQFIQILNTNRNDHNYFHTS